MVLEIRAPKFPAAITPQLSENIVKFGEGWYEAIIKVKVDVDDDGAGKIREKYDESRNAWLRFFIRLSWFYDVHSFYFLKETFEARKLFVRKARFVARNFDTYKL